MPSCRNTYQTAAQRAQDRILEAQQELEEELEIPMHHYVFPLPQPTPAQTATATDSAAATQLLEQMQCANQLLVDLLGAVNSLTAAVLCRRENNG